MLLNSQLEHFLDEYFCKTIKSFSTVCLEASWPTNLHFVSAGLVGRQFTFEMKTRSENTEIYVTKGARRLRRRLKVMKIKFVIMRGLFLTVA